MRALVLALILFPAAARAQGSGTNYGSAKLDAPSCANPPRVSTASVSNSVATFILPAEPWRRITVVTNECAGDVRIGPAAVTAAVGFLLRAGQSYVLDGPAYFRSVLYAFATGGAPCKVSTFECLQQP